MTAREELAAWLLANAGHAVHFALLTERSKRVWLTKADALLASPALARVVREAKAEAWDEGATRVWEPLAAYAYNPDFYLDDNPYRDQAEEQT